MPFSLKKNATATELQGTCEQNNEWLYLAISASITTGFYFENPTLIMQFTHMTKLDLRICSSDLFLMCRLRRGR